MSRLHLVKEAVRPEMWARVMLSGPAGAGKTHTALAVASILAEGEPIVVIDTERDSALTYADEFNFHHVPWDPPYDPLELSKDLNALASKGYRVGVIDSATHFWNGEGGILEIADQRYTGWQGARPKHRDMVTAILRAQLHMILCVRSKMAYAQMDDPNRPGKQKVEKLGLSPIQDSELEYEVYVALDLDMTHRLSVAKTRVKVLDGLSWAPDHEQEFAKAYKEWLRGGDALAQREVSAALSARLDALPGEGPKFLRRSAKTEFAARFGRPDQLTERNVEAASALVARFEQQVAPAGAVPATDAAATPAGADSAEVVNGFSEPPFPEAIRPVVTQAEAATSADLDGYAPPMEAVTKRKLEALLAKHKKDRHAFPSEVLGFEVKTLSPNAITEAHAQRVITALQEQKS